ncbi:hypothetical protein AMTRI_Chr05g57620 [Amborella trichopoda]
MIVIASICSLNNLIVFDFHSLCILTLRLQNHMIIYMVVNSPIAKSHDYLYGCCISMYYSFVYLQYYLGERLLYIHELLIAHLYEYLSNFLLSIKTTSSNKNFKVG